MTEPSEFRRQIASEAARLLARGKVSDFTAARKRAARRLKRHGLSPADFPTNGEIQQELYALAGLFQAEREGSTWLAQASAAANVMELLVAYTPTLDGPLLSGHATRGVPVQIWLGQAPRDVVVTTLRGAGFDVPTSLIEGDDQSDPAIHWRICLRDLDVRIASAMPLPVADRWSLSKLLAEIERVRTTQRTMTEPDEDIYDALELLVRPLRRVMLDSKTHPEGDALFHTLQVFELGLAQRPYDEEFLLGCLLHLGGLAINPRHPIAALLDASEGLLTDRTRWLIEHLPDGAEYLRTGQVAKSLQRHEDWDDLLELARCSRAGRVPGAAVRELDEAFAFVRELAAMCDDDTGNEGDLEYEDPSDDDA